MLMLEIIKKKAIDKSKETVMKTAKEVVGKVHVENQLGEKKPKFT